MLTLGSAHLLPLQLDKSFGFDTAVEQAQLPLLAAKTEARSALRGIGLVKVSDRLYQMDEILMP